MPLNELHSFADYTGVSLAARDPAEFSNTTIKGSCFSHETPDAKVFPLGTDGVAFERCNLCNVTLPLGSTTDARCQTTRYKAFEATVKLTDAKLKDASGEDAADQDWEVDKDDLPLRPLNVKQFEEAGWSTDPKDYTLTATKLDAAVTE